MNHSLLSKIRGGLLAVCASLALASAALVGSLAPMPADAAVTFSTTVRTAQIQSIITAAGASARLRLYTGTKPAATPGAGALPTATGTLLATLTFGSTVGTATAGALDWDEAGVTQTNTAHVNGTPGYARLETSGGVAVFDIDIGVGAGNWQFTGTVTNGQNVTLTTLVFNAGNAS